MSAPMNGPIGRPRPPTTAITRMSMTGGMPAVPGDDLRVLPDQQDAADRRDHAREGVGRDAMGGDVEAERGHAPRIVAHALQRQAERRARHVDDRQIGQRRAAERQIVERDRLAPVDAEQARRHDVG